MCVCSKPCTMKQKKINNKICKRKFSLLLLLRFFCYLAKQKGLILHAEAMVLSGKGRKSATTTISVNQTDTHDLKMVAEMFEQFFPVIASCRTYFTETARSSMVSCLLAFPPFSLSLFIIVRWQWLAIDSGSVDLFRENIRTCCNVVIAIRFGHNPWNRRNAINDEKCF